MVLIFSGSGDGQSYQHSSRIIEPLLHWLFPGMSLAHIQWVHLLVRKCAHLTEFGLLALLCWRAIRRPATHPSRQWRWNEAGLALGLVFIYSASDELHQTFIPGRTGQVSDVVVDVAGGTIGLLLLWGFHLMRARLGRKCVVTGNGRESDGC